MDTDALRQRCLALGLTEAEADRVLADAAAPPTEARAKEQAVARVRKLDGLSERVAAVLGCDPEDVKTEPRHNRLSLRADQVVALLAKIPEEN